MDWLGEVPGHWALKPLWTCFRRVKRTGFDAEELLSVYRDHGVVLKASREDNFNKPSDDLSVYQLVIPGDLAINKMKAWQGSVAISPHRGIVSPAYFVYEALHIENSRYLHYLMRSVRYITGYLSVSKGIRINQWDLEPQLHSRMPLMVPPLPEQVAIAAFLDRETAKIDALVAEQQRLIELLKEKRQAVICHAVTKGLNPDAPMKDSGVEWLGAVPEHWQIRRFQRCVYVVEGQVDPEEPGYASLALIAPNHVESGTGRLLGLESAEDQAAESGKYPCHSGDVVYSKIRPALRKVCIAPQDCLCSADMYPLRGHSGLSNGFLLWSMLSEQFSSLAVLESLRVAMPKINRESLKPIPLLLPPTAEQRSIVVHIEHETAKLDTLTREAQRAIDLLQERRTALISAAVTGQIDVRPASERASA